MIILAIEWMFSTWTYSNVPDDEEYKSKTYTHGGIEVHMMNLSCGRDGSSSARFNLLRCSIVGLGSARSCCAAPSMRLRMVRMWMRVLVE